MNSITPQTTVGELVATQPALMRVFERLGIDYCCGGKRTLAEASEAKGLDVNTIVQTLQAMQDLGQGQQEEQNWANANLADLCDHIEQTHHAYLQEELPRLRFLVEKIADVHGDRHPELQEVKQVLFGLADELSSHLMKEEQILFPAIRQLVGAKGTVPMPVSAPIQVMIDEHDSAGEALEKLRRLTNNYTTPADGCKTYRAAMEGLEQLETDLHRHISKENNILFPRAIALQEQ